jgi:hypothetical protein
MTMAMECCVPGCGRGTTHSALQTGEGLCAEHFLLASVQSRSLLRSAAGRLARLQRSWDDDRVFDDVVARGRYLAFCMLLQTAHDHLDRAWERVRSEVLGATVDPDRSSPSIAPITDLQDHRSGSAPSSLDSRRRILPAPQE